jgi:hypothetical protein
MVSNRDRKRGGIFLALVVSVAATGCAPGWTVIRDGGSPSPLRGAGPISVSFDYSRLMVEGRTERDFVALKKTEKPDYEISWNELKKQLETNFVIGMGQLHPPGVGLGPGAPTGVHVVVYPTNFTIGHYIVVASTSTELLADVVFYANGQQADVIGLASAVPATMYRPTVFAHMPPIATDIGRLSGKYVQSKNRQ